MILSRSLDSFFEQCGIKDIAGVPCSGLQPLFNYAASANNLIMACNEGDAVAFAAGNWLGGRQGAVCMQNSGLGNCVSPITSLLQTFQIPVLGFVSVRGEPGTPDEPQHRLMGEITRPLLSLLQLPSVFLSKDCTGLESYIDSVRLHQSRRESFFFAVQKGAFMPEPLKPPSPIEVVPGDISRQIETPEHPHRHEVLAAMLDIIPSDVAIITSTGYTGRELYTLDDRAGNFYMVGSMGCAPSIALGLARARPKKKIVVIDGDGALLMRLGNLSTIGSVAPTNLFHLLLNNEQHESTGGQATTASTTDLGLIAHAAGYPRSVFLHSIAEFQEELKRWLQAPVCCFANLPIRPGTLESLGRPAVTPPEVAARFRDFNSR